MNPHALHQDTGVSAGGGQREAVPYRPKIEELESIRGLAALLVVFFHTPRWNALFDIGIINNGYIMVDLFFVLSGFVIYTAYANKIGSGTDLFRFQFLRFGRLYPVHITFLLVFLTIEISKYIAMQKYGLSSPNSTPFKYNNLRAFIENIFLLTAVIPYDPVTFDYPAWSISAEFYTYLVFGLIVLFWKPKRIFIFAVLAAVSLGLVVTNSTFGLDAMLRCSAGFWMGAVTAHLIEKSKLRCPSYFSTVICIAIVLFLQLKAPHQADFLIYFLTAGLIATLLLSGPGRLKKVLTFRLFTWLGTISYSIYMSHAGVEWALNQVVRVIMKRPELIGPDGRSTPQLSVIETLIAYVVVVACVLAVSELVYIFIEAPFRERSRRYAARRFPVTGIPAVADGVRES